MSAVTKKNQGAEGVHRLENLEVKEVSIVDRPANGRKFSVVKEEGSKMSGTEITIDADGNLTTEKPETAETAENGNALALMFKTLESAFNDERITKSLHIPEDAKRAAFKTLRESLERIHTALGTVSVAQTTPEGSAGSPLMKLVGDELRDLSKTIAKLGKTFGNTEIGKSEDDEEATAFTTALEGVSAQLEEAKADVEKRGAKMAARRLQSFEKAISTLTKLLAELKGIEAQKEETTKAEAVAKSLTTEVETLKSELDDAKSKVKKQAAELRKLRDARPASAAIPVEKGEPGSEEDASEDAWPLDMNDTDKPSVRF